MLLVLQAPVGYGDRSALALTPPGPLRPAAAAATGGAGAARRPHPARALRPLPLHALHRRRLLRAARRAVRHRLPDREFTGIRLSRLTL